MRRWESFRGAVPLRVPDGFSILAVRKARGCLKRFETPLSPRFCASYLARFETTQRELCRFDRAAAGQLLQHHPHARLLQKQPVHGSDRGGRHPLTNSHRHTGNAPAPYPGAGAFKKRVISSRVLPTAPGCRRASRPPPWRPCSPAWYWPPGRSRS